MRLDSVTIPRAKLSEIKRNKLMAVHEYSWTDANHVQELKKGVLTLKVECVATTLSERDAIEEKCAQEGSKTLYYSSVIDGGEDRYYTVYTDDIAWTPVTATIYRGTFTATAADPYPYVTATDEKVYS